MMNWEDYFKSNTEVLRNKFDITNQDELYEKEKKIVLERLSILILYGMNGNFDANHLKAIHWYLFSPVYDFAGRYREVNVFKEHSSFLGYECIPGELNKVLKDAKDKKLNQDNLFDVAKFLGQLYYDLIYIHPFREGNGRSIREYLREFTEYKFPGLSLNYDKVDKKNFLLGITERDTYPLLLAYEIFNALEHKNKVK